MGYNVKMTEELVTEAQELFDNGWHIEDIAKEVGYSSMTLRNRLDMSKRPPYTRTGRKVKHNHILYTRW